MWAALKGALCGRKRQREVELEEELAKAKRHVVHWETRYSKCNERCNQLRCDTLPCYVTFYKPGFHTASWHVSQLFHFS